MSHPTYPRPLGTHRTELIVSHSRFITSIARADTVDEARRFISQIRAEMSDASHHVYAFRVGYGASITEGMSDDGEPAGTSGPPTLAVLRGTTIGDIVLVTTRYFGGMKLGTGGLVRAYSDAAKLALQSLPTELKVPKRQIGFDIPYSLYEHAKRLIETYHGTLDETIYADTVSIIATFLQETAPAFERDLIELSAGAVSVIVLADFE